MRWFTVALLVLIAQAHALSSHPVDEVVVGVNTTTGMELSLFRYKSGYSYGNTYGLERRATLDLPYRARFFTGDVDGDGVDELIQAVGDAQGQRLEIYRYSMEEQRLLRLDAARYSGGGSWQAGDVNGDGVDELVRILPGAGWTELYLYAYDPSYSRGMTEKLRRSDVLKYRMPLETWLCGDVDGDGRDELIAVEEASLWVQAEYLCLQHLLCSRAHGEAQKNRGGGVHPAPLSPPRRRY